MVSHTQLTYILSNRHSNLTGLTNHNIYPYSHSSYPTQQVDRLLNRNNNMHQQGATIRTTHKEGLHTTIEIHQQ